MIRHILTLYLLLGTMLASANAETDSNGIYSGNSKLTVDNINKATQALRDPSVVGGSLKTNLGKLSGNARAAVDDITRSVTPDGYDPENDESDPGNFKDPTKMSGSFRATMNKMTVRQTTTLTTTGTPTQLPKISLAAIVYGNKKEYFAMLHVNEETVLIKEGDKATFVDNNKVVDLVVQAITKNDVRIAVHPSNQLIVLR